MKRIVALTILAVLMAVAVPAQERQDKKDPRFDLVQFQLALLRRGPKWTGDANNEAMKLEREQRAYAASLLQSGKAVIAGRFTDDSEIRGLYILRTTSPAEGREWAEASPGVQAGYLVAEMHPWWAADILKKTATPDKLAEVYFGLLYRGDKWTAEKTPAIEELQKAHLANIMRLAEMKKLVIAGPIGDDTPLRGVFVFRVPSIDEARTLAATDPAIMAGRLKIEMHPWLVPEGILP